MSKNLRDAIERVKRGTWIAADIQEISTAAKLGNLVFVDSSETVEISGSVTQSSIVAGDKNIVDNRKIILNGPDAQTVQAVLSQQFSLGSSNEEVNIDELLLHAYLRCYDETQHLHSRVRLLNSKQIDVEKLYVELYILERPNSKRYATIASLLQEQSLRRDFDRFGLEMRSGKRFPGLETAKRFPKLMLLGKPGAGKSTFLKHLAISCCRGKFFPDGIEHRFLILWIKWELYRKKQRLKIHEGSDLWMSSLAYLIKSREPIPIIIELRSIMDFRESVLLDIMQKKLEFSNKQDLKSVIKTGRILLLIDGFDEISNDGRKFVQKQLEEIVRINYKTRIILTCRTQTVENVIPDFEYVEVADFNSKQIKQFICHWFTIYMNNKNKGNDSAETLVEKLKSTKYRATLELANTPILLSLICWIFQDIGDLPEKRIELYQKGLDLLLTQWDMERGIDREIGGSSYQRLSIEQKQDLLSYIAIRKQEKEQFVLFERQEIIKYVREYLENIKQKSSAQESRNVLNSLESQHGLVVERASNIYSFSHLTFQEYFAARWLCNPNNQHHLIDYITAIKGQELIRFALEIPEHANDIGVWPRLLQK